MRIVLASILFATAACSTSPPGGEPEFDSVRDRLSDGPTLLRVGPAGSTGAITARLRTSSGWSEGTATVAIEGGELSARVDARGRLAVDAFHVDFAPIELSEEVFQRPAKLVDVKVRLAQPVTADARWHGDDDATATLSLDLDFDWALSLNGGHAPLATQHFPPLDAELVLTGGGDHVDAAITLRATGELWGWAGLLEMTSLELSLAAATD